MWKKIKGYEGFYEINENADIKRIANGSGAIIGKILKHNFSKRHGRMSVQLSKNGKYKRFSVHRLLAEAFISNPKRKKVVNHSDIIYYESGCDFNRKTGFDHTVISSARKRGLKSYKFVQGKVKGLTVHFQLLGVQQ